jgi:hypothetical protein
MVAVAVVLAGFGFGFAVRALLAIRRRHISAGTASVRHDGPHLLVLVSLALLGGERSQWGRAMRGELAEVTDRRSRWRFAVGCLRAAALAPPGPGSSGRFVVDAVAAGAVGCAVLVGYGLVRYPGLVTGVGTWAELTVFLAVLAGYLLSTSAVLRRIDARSVGRVRAAVITGALTTVVWTSMSVLLATRAPASAFLSSWLAVPAASMAVGIAGAWHRRDVRTGRQAALLAAVAAGLLVFGGWVLDSVLSGGRPYDAGMVRDFHTSGAPDLATYAVSDNMGSAMMLLLIVPVLATGFGVAGAAVTVRLRAARGAR